MATAAKSISGSSQDESFHFQDDSTCVLEEQSARSLRSRSLQQKTPEEEKQRLIEEFNVWDKKNPQVITCVDTDSPNCTVRRQGKKVIVELMEEPESEDEEDRKAKIAGEMTAMCS